MTNVINMSTYKRAEKFERMSNMGDNVAEFVLAESQRLDLDFDDAVFASIMELIYIIEDAKEAGDESATFMHEWLGERLTNPEQSTE